MGLHECSICHGASHTEIAPSPDPISNAPLCVSCLEDMLRQEYLRDLDPDDLKKLRRRVEDLLRKNKSTFLAVAAKLAAAGEVKIDDLT